MSVKFDDFLQEQLQDPEFKKEYDALQPEHAIEFRTSQKPSRMKCPKGCRGLNWERKIEHMKSSARCKVEHPFLIVKNFSGYRKVAYRGIAKNMNRFNVLFASANLLMCTRP